MENWKWGWTEMWVKIEEKCSNNNKISKHVMVLVVLNFIITQCHASWLWDGEEMVIVLGHCVGKKRNAVSYQNSLKGAYHVHLTSIMTVEAAFWSCVNSLPENWSLFSRNKACLRVFYSTVINIGNFVFNVR